MNTNDLDTTSDNHKPTSEATLAPRPCSASATVEILEQVLAEIDHRPDDWHRYEGNWKNGYNQCRNRIAALLAHAAMPNDRIETWEPTTRVT